VKLTPADAAALYRSGMSACQIAAAHGITRQGAEARIRAGGLILRTCSGPTSRTSFGPTKIVCEEVPAPPGTVLGAEERRMTKEVAKGSGPGGVGPEEVAPGSVGPNRLLRVGPKQVVGNTTATVSKDFSSEKVVAPISQLTSSSARALEGEGIDA
jgi:hypothetical protein